MHRTVHADHVGLPLRVLDHDDRIRALREGGTRRHLDARPLVYTLRRDGVRIQRLEPLQLDGFELASRERVLGADRISVHGRSVREGNIDRRHDIPRCDAMEGVENPRTLRPVDRRSEFHEHPHRIVERDERLERAHPAAVVLLVVLIMPVAAFRGQCRITPTAWPSSGRIRDFAASSTAFGDPGRQNRRRPR